jgi:hypothetical protein
MLNEGLEMSNINGCHPERADAAQSDSPGTILNIVLQA